MHEDPSSVLYEFQGAIPSMDGSDAVFTSIRFEKFDPMSLTVRLNLLGSVEERRRVHSHLDQLQWNHFSIRGTGAFAGTVAEILGLTGFGSAGAGGIPETVIPHCTAIQLNITEERAAAPRRFWMTAQLTPSGIVIQPKTVTMHADGQITHNTADDGEIEVRTALARLRVREHYDTFEMTEHGNRVRHLVTRAVIEGEITVPIDRSFADVHAELRDILGSISLMLSLCYRTLVRHYEIRYLPMPLDQADRGTALLRVRIQRTPQRRHRDELIHYQQLTGGGLETLFQAFVSSPDRDIIRRIVSFLAGSYAADSLEESYILAYAALETTISTVAGEQEYAATSSQFSKLTRALKSAIRQFAEEMGLGTADAMVEKLPEIRRLSIKRRIDQVIRNLNVETSDLWQRLGFDAGLERATKNRNMLVHAASITAPEELLWDRVRLWILVERILLQMLGWTSEKISRWYDQDLRRVNKSDEIAASNESG
jgi:hypothetical protein